MIEQIKALIASAFIVAIPVQAAPPEWSETQPVAVPLIERWEGLPCDGQRCEAYLDTIAVPPVWTICSGITGPDVGRGDVRTPAECRADLRRIVVTYWTGFRNSLTETGFGVLTIPIDAAFTSLTYNIGVGAVSRSTAVRRLNAGDVSGACAAIGWWNRAGARVVRGLVNRRAEEVALCMEGTA